MTEVAYQNGCMDWINRDLIMRPAFLETANDIQWLKDTHLKGVPLPEKYQDFRFAILQGNEDCPYAVNLYVESSPRFDADYLHVTFDHEKPTYCEYCEYDGKTNTPKATQGPDVDAEAAAAIEADHLKKEDYINDAIDNLVSDNYERSWAGSRQRQADAALIRAALAAQPAEIERLRAERDALAAALEEARLGLRYAVRVWVLADEIAWGAEEVDAAVEDIIRQAKKEGRR